MIESDVPAFVTFRDPAKPADIYEVALDFTSRVFRVIQHAEHERFHLKDQLDRRSTAIAMLVARARDTPGGSSRRSLFEQARKAAMDCRSILDMVAGRNTAESSVLQPAREVAAELVARLAQLAIR